MSDPDDRPRPISTPLMFTVSDFEAAGFVFCLSPDLRLVVEYPGNPPADLLEAIRAQRDEIVQDLRGERVCVDCSATVTLDEIICPACEQDRYATRPIRTQRLAPYRRARMKDRLRGRRCGNCETEAWVVTPRGDAYCGYCHHTGLVAPADAAPQAFDTSHRERHGGHHEATA